MTDADGDERGDIDGMSVGAAAEAVVERDDTPDDEEAVAATLRFVSEEGVVDVDAVDDAIADASMYLSTAENRVEYAAVEFRETREAVSDVEDIAFVADRLNEFERRVAAIEEEATALAESLQEQVERSDDPDRVYRIANELARIKSEADRVQARADELKVDIEEFGSVVEDPEQGFVELLGDLNALDGFLDDLEATITELDGVVNGELEVEGEYDPARVWFEAVVRHRLNGLVFEDVRHELDSIRTLAERRGIEETERDTEVETRLGEIRERWEALREELAAVAPSAWHAEYEDRLADVESRTADPEPPIDWGAMEADLGSYLADGRPQ